MAKNIPTDKDLYEKVLAEAKRKFEVYPSFYANSWVVREYKARGGKYRVEKARNETDFQRYIEILRTKKRIERN